MEYVIKELEGGLKYHRKQREDNLREIETLSQRLEFLTDSIPKHDEAIRQIEEVLERMSKE